MVDLQMRTLEIKKNDANQRLDKFLQKHFKTMPKTLMYKYIRKKCIARFINMLPEVRSMSSN